MITDQIQQLKGLEVEEHQAIIDAGKRVEDKLDEILVDNPELAGVLEGVKSDIAALANIAATAGTEGSVTTPESSPA